MIGLLLGMRSAINWVQSIIFILGIHYEVVHDIILYACKFVLSVLVIFIVFYFHRYSRYHDSGLAFHLNRLTRYHESVLVFIQGDCVSISFVTGPSFIICTYSIR